METPNTRIISLSLSLQVINEIYPFWTYSYLVLLIPAFLATDYLRYKPLLILQAGSFIVTYAMIVKVQSVTAMQLLEFFFGLATATDIAYYSYIYSVVDQAHYQKVTGFCRSITLLGSSIGSLLGQVLVSAAQVPLQYLGIITLSFACIAFLTPWFLPMPAKSLFFHHKDLHKQENGSSASPTESEGDSLECKVPLNSEDHGVSALAAIPLVFPGFSYILDLSSTPTHHHFIPVISHNAEGQVLDLKCFRYHISWSELE